MATRRDEPYVWVTWITKLLAGEANCAWAAWFRAHHTYQRLPSDFDLAAWTADHAAMVRATAEALRQDGMEVFIEGQNAFKLRGSDGTVLAGKPDIVAVGGDRALVIDCKTGQPRMADHFQVMVYMLILPLTHRACRDMSIEGQLRYRDNTVKVPASKITTELRGLFRETMHDVGGNDPLPRVPSWDECRFCDIGAADCPQRVEAPTPETGSGHDLF